MVEARESSWRFEGLPQKKKPLRLPLEINKNGTESNREPLWMPLERVEKQKEQELPAENNRSGTRSGTWKGSSITTNAGQHRLPTENDSNRTGADTANGGSVTTKAEAHGRSSSVENASNGTGICPRATWKCR